MSSRSSLLNSLKSIEGYNLLFYWEKDEQPVKRREETLFLCSKISRLLDLTVTTFVFLLGPGIMLFKK